DNGTREWGGSADTLGHTISNFVTDLTFPNGSVATHTKNWVGKFTADVAGTIILGLPLPAGGWTINGASTWTKGARTWNVSVTTSTPLHFNPTCTAAPRFDAGQLDLVVTRNSQTFNVTIQFTGCGAFVVTRTPVV